MTVIGSTVLAAVAGATAGAMGLPHFGHELALLETSFPHSPHLINAMTIHPIFMLR